MARDSKGIFLDVDSTIVENNLRFAKDPDEEEFNKLFPIKQENPSKIVRPFPGFCVKTKEVGTDRKFFLNVCHTDALPSPADITEEELQDVIGSEDCERFKVPMSIGDIKEEKDNKGNSVKTCDIAISTNFFNKTVKLAFFKSFFLSIAFEGIAQKHGIVCENDKIILANKKAFGNLQLHRIEQRVIDQKMKQNNNNLSVMEEITGTTNVPGPKPIIETISSSENVPREPEYRLYRRKDEQKNCLIGEFKFPDLVSVADLTVDIGEDRILIESKSKQYLLDIFVPHIIRQENCSSSFDKNTKTLTVQMPLVGG